MLLVDFALDVPVEAEEERAGEEARLVTVEDGDGLPSSSTGVYSRAAKLLQGQKKSASSKTTRTN